MVIHNSLQNRTEAHLPPSLLQHIPSPTYQKAHTVSSMSFQFFFLALDALLRVRSSSSDPQVYLTITWTCYDSVGACPLRAMASFVCNSIMFLCQLPLRGHPIALNFELIDLRALELSLIHI